MSTASEAPRPAAPLPQAARPHLPALTGLRGVAAAWVVLFHLADHHAGGVLGAGWLGVDIFFFLSGFVLCYVYAEAEPAWRPGTYLRFLKVRLARIYPLHAAMLLVMLLMVVALPGFAGRYPMAAERWSVGSFIASVLLVQNWAYFWPGAWNDPAWSLSAEWFAYLSFPLFLWCTQWPRSGRAVLAGVILAFAILLGMLARRGLLDTGVTGTPGMVRMACEFAIGCGFYRARRIGLPALLDGASGLVDAVALLLIVLGVTLGLANLLALPGCALLVLRATSLRSPSARLLSLAPLVFLGEISYSLYLTHWPLIQFYNWLFEGGEAHGPAMQLPARLGLLLAATLLSVASYRMIERPARAFGRRLALA